MKIKKMKTASALLGSDDVEEIIQIPLRELCPFEQHPFLVMEDANFLELKNSIETQGVATPIIVRPKGRGTFEIVSGHRRSKACELLGMETIPAVIRDLVDAEAVLFMVDTNIQREELRFSEKAFAYRMKLDALKQQGKRTDLTSDPLGQKSSNGSQGTSDPLGQKSTTRELLAHNSNDSSVQIQRYIRLTYLLPALLAMVDQKKLPFQTGVELSYLSSDQQTWLFHVMDDTGKKPSLEQAVLLKKESQSQTLTKEGIESLFVAGKTKVKTLSLKADMSVFFPEETTSKEMEQVIIELLTEWKERQ